MALLYFIAVHYGFLVLLAFACYLIGLRITHRVSYDSFWQELSINVSLGLGVIAYLVSVLGMFGLLYPTAIVLAIIGCLAACYPVFKPLFQRMQSALKHRRLGSKLLIGGVVIGLSSPILTLPLYPPTGFDETFYYLTTAKVYARNHQIIFTPYLRFPVLTQLNEMLSTLGLVLYDDIAVHMIQLLMLTMLVAAMVAFCRRHLSSRAGWWAAAILLANPLVISEGVVGEPDIALALFAGMAGFTFFNWIRTREEHWPVLSGAFCGLAAATKYPGLFFPLSLGMATLFVAIRRRNYRTVVRFVALALAIASPWYIRNFYYTGNPVFPFFPEIFGYSIWNADDLRGLLTELHSHGVGRSLTSLITLPWYLTFNQSAFLSPARSFSPIFFPAIPIIVFFSIKDTRIRTITCLVAAFTLFWFFTAQVLRYLLPVIPMLSVASAASLDMLDRQIGVLRKWSQHPIVIALVFCLLISEGWLYALRSCELNGPVPVTNTQRDEYLIQHFPSYPVYKLMNDTSGRNYKLYSMFDENMAYFVNGVYMGDYFGPARYTRILDKLSDGQALYEELKSLGTDYFLINNGRLPITLPQDSFFRENFHLAYSRDNVVLYGLDGGPTEQGKGPQLLINTGFELVSNEWPVGWGHAGNPIIDTSGQYSHSGSAAVRCLGADNIFFQGVVIKPGGNYLLEFQIRGVSPKQEARIQVNWSDASGKFLSTDLQVIEVDQTWKRYETVVIAPEQASAAVVYASCHYDGSAWFDDFSFTEARVFRR